MTILAVVVVGAALVGVLLWDGMQDDPTKAGR